MTTDRRDSILRFVTAFIIFGTWEAAEHAGLIDPLFFEQPLTDHPPLHRHGRGRIDLATRRRERDGDRARLCSGGAHRGPGRSCDGAVQRRARNAGAVHRGDLRVPNRGVPSADDHLARIGIPSKVALVFLGCVIIIIVNTETGVAQVDRRLVETARSFMAKERRDPADRGPAFGLALHSGRHAIGHGSRAFDGRGGGNLCLECRPRLSDLSGRAAITTPLRSSSASPYWRRLACSSTPPFARSNGGWRRGGLDR